MMIAAKDFESGLTYSDYRKLVDKLAAEGGTTGSEQSAERQDFTKLNAHRMHRLDKTVTIPEHVKAHLEGLKCKIRWLVLSESWCGDAAQNLPVLAKMAECSPLIDLRILIRDEHLDIMDQFLTNGGRAIPKLIILDAHFNVTATWGPRPAEIQQQVLENKLSGRIPYSEFALIVQKWYLQNKGLALMEEMLLTMGRAGCLTPSSAEALASSGI